MSAGEDRRIDAVWREYSILHIPAEGKRVFRGVASLMFGSILFFLGQPGLPRPTDWLQSRRQRGLIVEAGFSARLVWLLTGVTAKG